MFSSGDYGCCVFEDAVEEEIVDAVANEMAPFVDDTPRGTSDFAGVGTRRTGLVVGRSPARHWATGDAPRIHSLAITFPELVLEDQLGHWRCAEDPFTAIEEHRKANR